MGTATYALKHIRDLSRKVHVVKYALSRCGATVLPLLNYYGVVNENVL